MALKIDCIEIWSIKRRNKTTTTMTCITYVMFFFRVREVRWDKKTSTLCMKDISRFKECSFSLGSVHVIWKIVVCLYLVCLGIF